MRKKAQYKVGDTVVVLLGKSLATIKSVWIDKRGHGYTGQYWHYSLKEGGCASEKDLRLLTKKEKK